MKDDSFTSVQLAPPGAGLPKPELLIARLKFRRFRKKHDRAARTAFFKSEFETLLGLVGYLRPELGAQQVLIKRLRGLEDSSRNWSVYMVLEHLRIVNDGISGIIQQLQSGNSPSQILSTADVKPAPGLGLEVVEAFERSCESWLRFVETPVEWRSDPTRPHPWFGPLNPDDWHALAAMHMGLHRRQVERILATQA